LLILIPALCAGLICHAEEGALPAPSAPGPVQPLISAPQSAGIYPIFLLPYYDGSFFGACSNGGTDDAGSVFQMDSTGNITTLANFDGANGFTPNALIVGPDGNLYGSTQKNSLDGGTGSLFMIVPDGSSSTMTSLWNFSGGIDGSQPSGGSLVLGLDNNIYGVTTSGGQYGAGVIFVLPPNGQNSTPTTIWSFTGGSDGSGPVSLTPTATSGTFYGLASGGGDGFGAVFELVVNGTNTAVTNIASFGDYNGAGPVGRLVLGANGNYYGMTAAGGADGEGTIFEVTTAGGLTTLVSFDGGPNGAIPSGTLLLAPDGNFYGVTTVGGARHGGTIFRLTQEGKLTTLVNCDPRKHEVWSPENLVEGADQRIYGISGVGGGHGDGCVYRVTPIGATARVTDLADLDDGSVPAAVPVPAADIGEHDATVLGIVDPNGIDTTAVFVLTSAALANPVTSKTLNFSYGISGKLAEYKFTGLAESTTYFYSVHATNAYGAYDYSYDFTFSTKGKPTIVYGFPLNPTSTTVTFFGDVNPRGETTTTYIQYGTTPDYGMKTQRMGIGHGIENFPLVVTLTGLTPSTGYHCRLVAVSHYGTVFGPDETFTTP
jgi:uncharacterized repeat protein (TIGR03803 family)